jgi:16S rRNA (adenine(1408)-N(1))-methyltransferase
MVPAATRGRKGSAANVLFVCATAEEPPDELCAIADQVVVQLPWGLLLAGVVTGDPAVCGGLRAIARPGARLDVVIGTHVWRPPVPGPVRSLPEPTPSYVASTLAPRLAAAGWRIDRYEPLGAGDRAGLTSSWGRRLRARPAASFAHLRATAVDRPSS